MNARLKELLEHEARAVQPPPAPINPIVAAGRSRLVRRRLLVGACAVAVAAVALAVPAALRPATTSAPPAVDVPTLDNLQLAWADAETIHFRGATTERPDGLAFVASTPEMALWITLPNQTSWVGQIHGMDADGRTYDLGSVTGPTIATDPGGSNAAWMRPGADARELVVLDTADRVERATLDAPEPNDGGEIGLDGLVIAVDDTTVWFQSDELAAPGGPDRTYEWSWSDGAPLPLDLPADTLLVDVEPDAQARVPLEAGPRLSFVPENGDQVASGEFVAGEFDPTGSYFVALPASDSDPSLELLAPAAGQPVALSGMPGEMVMAGWDPSGVLVAITTEAEPGWLRADDVLNLVACNPGTATCAELDEAPLTAADAPMVALSGYLGYTTADIPIVDEAQLPATAPQPD